MGVRLDQKKSWAAHSGATKEKSKGRGCDSTSTA